MSNRKSSNLIRQIRESFKNKIHMSFLLLLFFVSTFISLAVLPSTRGTYYWNLYAEADSYIENGDPNRNKGWAQNLQLYYPGGTEFYTHAYTLIRFNLDAIPSDATIEYASIRLYLTQGQGEVEVRRITSPWQETSVTWNNKPSTYSPIGPYIPNSKNIGPGPVSVWWDVTQIVKGWFDGSYPNHGLLLKPLYETEGNECWCEFYSRQYPTHDMQPRLQVDFDTPSSPPPPPTPPPTPTPDETPPTVTITNTPSGTSFDTPTTVTVTARATDNTALQSLELLGPGNPPQRWVATEPNTQIKELTYTVRLDSLNNVFTARAYDWAGLTASFQRNIQIGAIPPNLQISTLEPITQHGPHLITDKQTIFKFNYTLQSTAAISVPFHLKLEKDRWDTTLETYTTERIDNIEYIVLQDILSLEPTPDNKPQTAYLLTNIDPSEAFLPKPRYLNVALKVQLEADPLGWTTWHPESTLHILETFNVEYKSGGGYETRIKILFLEPTVGRFWYPFTSEETEELSNKLINEPLITGGPYPYELYLNAIFPAKFSVNHYSIYESSGYSIGWWDADTIGETAADEGYGRVIAIVPTGAISEVEGGSTIGVVYHRFYGKYDQSYHVAFVEIEHALDSPRYQYFPVVAHELSHTYRYPDIYDGYEIIVPYEECAYFDEIQGGLIRLFRRTILVEGDIRFAPSFVLDPLPGEAWANPVIRLSSPTTIAAWDIMDHSGQANENYWSHSSYENVYRYTYAAEDPPEALLISMVVFRNGTVIERPFQKLYNQTIRFPSTDAKGNFALILYDRNGKVFRKYPYNASFHYTVEPYGLREAEAIPFLSVVEWTDNLGRIELQDQAGQIWFKREVSAHSPTIKITSPQKEAALQTQKSHRISWEGNDQDSDPLWYTVLIKEEASEVWQSLASRIQNTSITFTPQTTNIEGRYTLQIKVTDGVNTAVETIAFSLTQETPTEFTPAIYIIAIVIIITVIFAIIKIQTRKKTK